MKQKNTLYAFLKNELPFALSIPAVLWQVLFLYIPLASVLVFSLVTVLHTTEAYQFTLGHYIALLKLMYFWIIIRSLLLALVTAIICLVFAYPVAYYLALHVKKWKNVCLFFLILPFWTNFLVQIYAWFFVLGKYGLINDVLLYLRITSEPLQLINNSFAVYTVMVYCYLPFMILPLYSILEKFDRRLLEASFDLGADTWKTFVRVTLPLTFSGIKTGVFLVFIPAFGEFAIPALLGGGKQFYVGSLIAHFFVTTHERGLGSAFTMMTGLILVGIFVCVYLLLKRKISSIVLEG